MINVSSGGMYTARLDVDDLQLEQREFDGPAFYAHTKRAEVALTELWAQRPEADGLVFPGMHPGWADTPGLSDSLLPRLMRPLLRDARQGADTTVWLATTPSRSTSAGGSGTTAAPARPTDFRPRASPNERPAWAVRLSEAWPRTDEHEEPMARYAGNAELGSDSRRCSTTSPTSARQPSGTPASRGRRLTPSRGARRAIHTSSRLPRPHVSARLPRRRGRPALARRSRAETDTASRRTRSPCAP